MHIMNSDSDLCQINLTCLRGLTHTSFTILKPTGDNFAYIFFDTDDLVPAAHKFFVDTLWKDANIPKIDSEKAAGFIRDIFPECVEFKVE